MKTSKPKPGSDTATPGEASGRKPAVANHPSEIILLAVTGRSPAVLTETVWALAHLANGSEPTLPDRVIALTTTEGRGEIERRLFKPLNRFGGRTAWDTLRAALESEGLDLSGKLRFGTTGDDVRVITAAEPATGRSRELADLRTPVDNEAAADFVLEQVRAIVENPDTTLIASIAGGRKTMGALLYACLTLVGRETDRLTHVLVSEPFETLGEFFFPSQPGGLLVKSEGRNPKCKVESVNSFDPADARVELADVPFVPLRNLFVRDLGQPAGTFSRLVDLCRANVRRSAGEHLRMEIETSRNWSDINGRRLELAPREHLVLLFFAQRAKHGETVLSAYDEALVALNEFRQSLRQEAPPDDWSDWRHAESLNKAFDVRELTRVLSDIRAKARRAGGDAAFLAIVLPEKGRCSLDVPGPLIHIKA